MAFANTAAVEDTIMGEEVDAAEVGVACATLDAAASADEGVGSAAITCWLSELGVAVKNRAPEEDAEGEGGKRSVIPSRNSEIPEGFFMRSLSSGMGCAGT